MSFFIIEESRFWLNFVLLGVGITLVYDCLRILRRVFPHGIIWISLEDLVYWIFVSFSIFYLLYYENNGAFRWFAIFGAALGMLLYKKSLSEWLVTLLSGILLRVRKLVGSMWRFVTKPLRMAGGATAAKTADIARKLKRTLRFLKKRLTAWLKMAKIVLWKSRRGKQRGRVNDKKKNCIPSEEKGKPSRYADGNHNRADVADRRFGKKR